jgi:hypothetical protein
MSDHFLGLNRGQNGVKYSDFTVGATTAHNIIEAFERYFENAQQVKAGGFVVSG